MPQQIDNQQLSLPLVQAIAKTSTNHYSLAHVRSLPYEFVPGGMFPAAGLLLPIGSNTSLFSLLGSNYGGNGQTTFALPDACASRPGTIAPRSA